MLELNVTSTGTLVNNSLNFAAGTGGSYDIDEIKLGDSYASVTGVPEPSAVTYVLLGVASWRLRVGRASGFGTSIRMPSNLGKLKSTES